MSNIKDLSKKIERALEQAKSEMLSRPNMQRLGTQITTDMVKRIQLGYGARENEGNREKLLPLADSTKKQRAGKLAFWTNPGSKNVVPVENTSKNNKLYIQKNKPVLSSNTSPNKSNLTRTGLLMRNIGSLVTGLGTLTIGFRSDYGARVAAFVSKLRPFFYVTNQEAKRATQFVQKTFKESLNRAIRSYFQ